jgi:acyl-CoA synthetase (AMP-forming)/AMP-acid ligase II
VRGKMMTTPLTITEIMRFADRHHGRTEVVSVTADQPLHRCTFNDVFRRARQLANALSRLGIEPGERVASLAWNDYRHLELYFGVACAGRVLHTINPRLFAEQLVYIINHAEDRVLFVDIAFLPLIEALADKLPTVDAYVVLTPPENMPESTLSPLHSYESLLEAEANEYEWPALDENAANLLCYTSGTTGNPKGVLYSHRSTVLHAYASCMPDAMQLSQRDTVLPVVPMFHVNAWGTPYACAMTGAKMVMPGPKMADGEILQRLIEQEKVTIALGVPTVWLALLAYLRESGKTVPSLARTVVGGAACPPSVIQEFEEKHGVHTHHAWGMTETSPLGTFNSPLRAVEDLSPAERDAVRLKQGRGLFGVDMKIVGDEGEELPWDGEAFGDLKVKGWWVCDGYFGEDGSSDAHDDDGWFATGDVATIDPLGYMKITDRTKDLIKSGGEWISSIELENVAVGHPGVAEAAVIGISHEKWTERPLLIVVPEDGSSPDKQELVAWFKGKVADWWIPDEVVLVDKIPHTATGKISKTTLREQFADYSSQS